MTTRRAKNPGEPISQARYMSSPEFAEMHGLNAIPVKEKAAITLDARCKRLLWFLQGRSLGPGGIRGVADELLAMFPERLGTPSMHALSGRHAAVAGGAVDKVYSELGMRNPENDPWEDIGEEAAHAPGRSHRSQKPVPYSILEELCRRVARGGNGCSDGYFKVPALHEFLVDLCINPKVRITTTTNEQDEEFEAQLSEQFPELEAGDVKRANLPYFQDVIGGLLSYMEKCEARVNASFVVTEIGRKIWETLDFGLKTGSMVLVDGLEGRGKTVATQAWCQAHLGEARYVSLKGINSKTAVFREMAKVLGVASSYTRKASEMQARVEDVLECSGLMIVIDEAHWLFNQSARIYTRPELVDWVVTALCNRSVPVALVTTPQFLQCMGQAVHQVHWNHRQFQRRVARRVVLAKKNSFADIERVARSIFPGAATPVIKRILGYVALTKRDLSALGDLVRELNYKLSMGKPGIDGSSIEFEVLEELIDSHLVPGDAAFAEDLERVINQRNAGRGRRPGAKTQALPEFAGVVEPSTNEQHPGENENAQQIQAGRNSAAPVMQASCRGGAQPVPELSI